MDAEVVVLVAGSAASVIACVVVNYLRFHDRFSQKSQPDSPPTVLTSEPDTVPTIVTSQEPASYDPVKGYVNLPPRQFSAFHLATQRGMSYRAEFDARITMVGRASLDSVDWPKHGPLILTLSGKATETVAAVLRDAEFQAEGEDWVWRSPTRRSLRSVGSEDT